MFFHQPEQPKLNRLVLILSEMLEPHYPEAPARAAELKKRWLSTYRPDSIRSFTNDLNRWATWIQEFPGVDPPLSLDRIIAYADHLRLKNLTTTTIGRYLYVLRLLQAVIQPDDLISEKRLREFCKAHPCRTFDPIRTGHHVVALTRGLLGKLEAAADPWSIQDARLLACAWLMYDTQLPPRRLLGYYVGRDWMLPPLASSALRRSGEGHVLELPATATEPAVTKNVSEETMAWIARFHEMRGAGDFVFTNRYGMPFQLHTWKIDMRHLVKRSGLKLRIGLASCRRGAAADMLLEGASAQDICNAAHWLTLYPLIRLVKSTHNGGADIRPHRDVSKTRGLPTSEPVRSRLYGDIYRTQGARHRPVEMGDLFDGMDHGVSQRGC